MFNMSLGFLIEVCISIISCVLIECDKQYSYSHQAKSEMITVYIATIKGFYKLHGVSELTSYSRMLGIFPESRLSWSLVSFRY
jgi:hypothetical protein